VPLFLGEIDSPGPRDYAILSIVCISGLRCAEIATSEVGDQHHNRGYDSLKVMASAAALARLCRRRQARRRYKNAMFGPNALPRVSG